MSEAYDAYVPIDDAAEMARLIPAALAAFGTPRVVELEASDVCGIAWDTLYAALPSIVDAQQHPLSASASRTRFYFDLFVAPVISTMNRTRPRQLFIIGHDLHIAVDQQEDLASNHPRIHIRGDSSAYVEYNGQPFCLVDLKPYDAQTTVHFDAGRNQVLLGAAALGFKEQSPSRRISPAGSSSPSRRTSSPSRPFFKSRTTPTASPTVRFVTSSGTWWASWPRNGPKIRACRDWLHFYVSFVAPSAEAM
jgi:hypothetical protein